MSGGALPEPVPFLTFLIARFCLRDLLDFLLMDWRGDLSDLTLLEGCDASPAQ